MMNINSKILFKFTTVRFIINYLLYCQRKFAYQIDEENSERRRFKEISNVLS